LARKNGQIIARGDGRWLVRVYLGRDQKTCRRKYLNRTIRGGFRAAQHFLNAQLKKSDQGRELDLDRLTVNEYLDRWLKLAVQPKLRSKSASDYRALLDRYIRPALGLHTLRSLAPLDLQRVYHQMYEKGLSKRTIHYVHAVVHAALEQAVGWRVMMTNPASDLAVPQPAREQMRVLDPDEARRFLEYAERTRYGVLFSLALTTGMRPSEYLALLWSDIDWHAHTVSVVRTLEKGRGWTFAPTKRPSSRRQVKLESWVAGRLWHLYIGEPSIPDLSPPTARPIFRSRSGRPVNSDYLARTFKRLLRAVGLEPMRLYDLRHTAATLALAAGVSAKVVSEQLGHASSAFTLDCYSHVLPHMQTEAAMRVESLLRMGGLHVEGNPTQIRKTGVGSAELHLSPRDLNRLINSQNSAFCAQQGER
jgi:integrase